MGKGLHRVLTLDLTAADPDGIAQTQNPGGAGDLTLNGAYVVSGVAILPEPQQVALTTGGDETAFTVTLYGTSRNGQAISEVVTLGNNTIVYSTLNFKTVTRAAISGNSGNVTIGTNERASSDVHVIGWHGNRTHYLDMVQGAGNQSIVEYSYANLAPAWDVEAGNPLWHQFDFNSDDKLEGATMIRLTNLAGSSLSTLTIVTPEGR
jgi:hypothetical protein